MPSIIERNVPGAAATVHVTELPAQGRETYGLIRQGGPFPYDKDGTVFGTFARTTGINPLLESGATFDGTNVIKIQITQDDVTKNCTLTVPGKRLVCEE